MLDCLRRPKTDVGDLPSPQTARPVERALRALGGSMTKKLDTVFDAPVGRRTFLKGAAATAALPALGALGGTAAAQEAVELTYWAWTPGDPEMVAAFMKAYPNIKINYQNVGQGGPHYQKLRDALTAGSGIPDVAQMEFNSI